MMTKTILRSVLPQTFLQRFLGPKRQPDRARWPGASIFSCKCPNFQTKKRSLLHVLGDARFDAVFFFLWLGCARRRRSCCMDPQMITHSFVQRWFFNNRISGEIEWTPVQPPKNGNWKQLPSIESIFAACDNSDTRRLIPAMASDSGDADDRGRRRRQRRPPPASDSGEAAGRRRRRLIPAIQPRSSRRRRCRRRRRCC